MSQNNSASEQLCDHRDSKKKGVWCRSCAKRTTTVLEVDGKFCCEPCGRVLYEDNLSQHPTFVKDSNGQSKLAGSSVKHISDKILDQRERIFNEAREVIQDFIYVLGIDGGHSMCSQALAYYTIAFECNFNKEEPIEKPFSTRGRKKKLVLASCLYIACRINKKPYLLIDFSEYLGISVYALGAVFLRLCELLSLKEHSIVKTPVDPSLFIHRFTDRLFGERKPNVSRTALHIVASMKRDWIQTGRKPSGICGAALFIASLAHGLKCSKTDIIKVVHVCEATLYKRLIEFEKTESAGLTVEEFNERAEELGMEKWSYKLPNTEKNGPGISELLCEHKEDKEKPPHFAHGLCKACYEVFYELSGGLGGESDAPAYQRAERERLMKAASAEDDDYLDSSGLPDHAQKDLESDKQRIKPKYNLTGDHDDGTHTGDHNDEEPESLSDIDDDELNTYLLQTEAEKQDRAIAWDLQNAEYNLEMKAKEAAAQKAKEAFANCSEDVQAAQRLAAASAAAVSKSKKEKRQKRAAELKASGPPKTAAEAVKRELDKKRLSSKINYDVLDELFAGGNLEKGAKKARKTGEEDYYYSNNQTTKGKEEEEEEEEEDQGEFDDVNNGYDAYPNFAREEDILCGYEDFEDEDY